MAATEFPGYVAGLLERLTNLLAERGGLVGVYVYGSLVTGDFSAAASDIDVVVLLASEPDQAAVGELAALHQSLMPADPPGQLHCLYTTAEHGADAGRLCTYWFGTRMTQWQMKLMTQAELATGGRAWHGPWPPPGIGPVPMPQLQAAVHAEVTGYYRRMAGRRLLWLQDTSVDHLLVALPRAEALLATGELITKGAAIGRLADFGQPVRQTRAGKLRRATIARRILRNGVDQLSLLEPGADDR